ncbi:MAG: hypothetical protein J5967_01620 [Oscillospiraceae bacterium]|nr:hypothetical protein [Oscillospiraceae bacterium]
MKLRMILRRMLRMCPEAWYIFLFSVKLTAFLLLCAFVLLLGWNGNMLLGYRQYMTAMALYEIGQALLLVGVLFSVLIEDAQEKR